MLQKRLSPTTKRLIVTGGIIGALIVLYTLRTILPPFLIALVVAYVLNPLVEVLVRITRRSRTAMVAIIYLALAIGLTLSVILVPPALVRQVQAINIDLEAIAGQVRQFLNEYQHIEFVGFTLDLQALSGEIKSAVQTSASFLAARTGGMVISILSGLAWGILILLVSFYLLKDAPKAMRYIHDALPESYQADFLRLTGEINAVLNSYLRGQLTGLLLAILGVRNALLLGVLAGVLEVIPNIGPIMAAIPAIASAFFRGSTIWPIETHWFALVVTGLYVVIQQVENNVLVPRIIGSSVQLHPVVIIFGVLAGASVAGILGALLAIPTITIARILAGYVYQKLSE
jgi:predicted PurR-regulated permease PerM